MSWRKKDTGLGRREIATMLVALEKQAREASHLAEKAHRSRKPGQLCRLLPVQGEGG